LALLRNIRPHVLHAHLYHANLLARLARLVTPLPVLLSTIHSLAESHHASASVRLRDFLYRLTDPLSDRTISVSRAVAERHLTSRAVSPRRSAVIPNGVHPEDFTFSEAERCRLRESLGLGEGFVWLAAGRLMWKKDYATMLLATSRQPGTTLLIAGEGPLEAELRRQAETLGADVRFLGLRGDIPLLMKAADGFVLSSVVEGLPLVLIEAALAGLPAVATDVGGVREILLDGESGFVVPPKDPVALARAMASVAAMPGDARREMGEAARRHAARQFGMVEVANQWESLYRECLLEAEQRLLP
ncbi:MAG: glycosyltransferase, partial [Bryobacterales bacterium]|nr:glycosyltransferase [Bryobacterales bacterium]